MTSSPGLRRTCEERTASQPYSDMRIMGEGSHLPLGKNEISVAVLQETSHPNTGKRCTWLATYPSAAPCFLWKDSERSIDDTAREWTRPTGREEAEAKTRDQQYTTRIDCKTCVSNRFWSCHFAFSTSPRWPTKTRIFCE